MPLHDRHHEIGDEQGWPPGSNPLKCLLTVRRHDRFIALVLKNVGQHGGKQKFIVGDHDQRHDCAPLRDAIMTN
jgi:hypothetical protein